MTIQLNQPTFKTDTDIRAVILLKDVTEDGIAYLSIKKKDDAAEDTIYFQTITKKVDGTQKIIEKSINGLEPSTEYSIKAKFIPTLAASTTVESNVISFTTQKKYSDQYTEALKTVFKELTANGTLYQTMITQMQTEVEKFVLDDFQNAQILAQFMAQITAGLTSEASRTALSLVDKEKNSAKNSELIDLQRLELLKKIELEQTQIDTTKASVQHNLLIKLVNSQENYAQAMASNSIKPKAEQHTNYFIGIKEGYRWAGFTYTDDGKILGTDGTDLGKFTTEQLV